MPAPPIGDSSPQYTTSKSTKSVRSVVDAKIVAQRHVEARKKMLKSACTTPAADKESHEYRSLRTTPHELGEYGVGVQLYFEYLWMLGLVFLVLLAFSIPSLAWSHKGTLLNDFADTKNMGFGKSVSLPSIANLGTCALGKCLTKTELRNRPLTTDIGSKLVRDVTYTISVLDLVCMLIILGFLLFFEYIFVPRVVRINDEAHVTAADFSVEVSGLPRKLEGTVHKEYEQELKKHFEKILVDGKIPQKDAIVREVTLIREYDGCIKTFSEQGQTIQLKREAKEAQLLAEAEGRTKDVEKFKKQEEALQAKLIHLEDSMQAQGSMKDEAREVCGAFIMFDREAHKTLVLETYEPSRVSFILRLRQPESLRFWNKCLNVFQAVEPTDVFWENLDYSLTAHHARKGMTCCAAVVLVIVTLLLLNLFRASDNSVRTDPFPSRVWAVQPQSPALCFDLCSVGLGVDVLSNATVPISRVVTDKGIFWDNATNLTKTPLLDPSNLCTNGAEYESVACTSGLKKGFAAFEFSTPQRIARVAMLTNLQKGLEIYGCPYWNVSNGFVYDSSGKPWEPGPPCIRYQDIGATEDFPADPFFISQENECTYPVSMSSASYARSLGEDPATGTLSGCFCQQNAADAVLSEVQNPATDFCKDWIAQKRTKSVLKIVSIVAVLILNNLLLVVFSVLDVLARYRTATDLANNQMFNFFLAEFINTGIIYLIVGMQFHRTTSNPFFDALKIGTGDNDDMARNWFVSTGSQIFVTILTQVIFSTAFPVVWVWTVDPLTRWYFARGVVTQDMLDEVYIFPEFTLSLRVAEAMVILFCVLIYSGVYPLLYFVGFIYCFLSYWADKYALLRGSRRPPQYTRTAIRYATQLMPVAVVCHLIFTLWAFGMQDVFPSDWSPMLNFAQGFFRVSKDDYDLIMDVFRSSSSSFQETVYRDYVEARLLDMARWGCQPLFLLILAIGIYYIIFFFLSAIHPFFGSQFNYIHESVVALMGRCGIRLESADTKETYLEAKKRLENSNKHLLFTYKLAANPRYEDAANALNYDPRADVEEVENVEDVEAIDVVMI